MEKNENVNILIPNENYEINFNKVNVKFKKRGVNVPACS